MRTFRPPLPQQLQLDTATVTVPPWNGVRRVSQHQQFYRFSNTMSMLF
jgi:hypothetical protein